MRPNFPSQIAQRLAAPLQTYWELLRILASSRPRAPSINGKTKMMQRKAQSYMGKSPILKGIGKLYGGLWCLFSVGVELPWQ
jgi:hypothetical protein